MKPFWLSWYHYERLGAFELHWPWWVSGHTDDSKTICAVVRADNALAAQSMVYHAYDKPSLLTFRFCEEKSASWEPFGERFPRADWMEW